MEDLADQIEDFADQIEDFADQTEEIAVQMASFAGSNIDQMANFVAGRRMVDQTDHPAAVQIVDQTLVDQTVSHADVDQKRNHADQMVVGDHQMVDHHMVVVRRREVVVVVRHKVVVHCRVFVVVRRRVVVYHRVVEVHASVFVLVVVVEAVGTLEVEAVGTNPVPLMTPLLECRQWLVLRAVVKDCLVTMGEGCRQGRQRWGWRRSLGVMVVN